MPGRPSTISGIESPTGCTKQLMSVAVSVVPAAELMRPAGTKPCSCASRKRFSQRARLSSASHEASARATRSRTSRTVFSLPLAYFSCSTSAQISCSGRFAAVGESCCLESVFCMSPFFFVRVRRYAGSRTERNGPCNSWESIPNYLIQFSKKMPLQYVWYHIFLSATSPKLFKDLSQVRPSLLLPQACGSQSLNVAPSSGTAPKSHYVLIGGPPRGHPPRASNYAKYCAWQVVCPNILWSEASRRPGAAAPAKLSAWKKRKPEGNPKASRQHEFALHHRPSGA